METSIVIPVYRRQGSDDALLRRCLASLERQTYRDFDITVVDDGSTAPLRSALQISDYKFQIRLIRQAHAGAPAARNRGARETNSEFLLFCDADVVLRPNALARWVLALHDHPDASYAYSRFRFGWKLFRGFPFDPERLREMPYIHTTALMRRAHFPGFDESLHRFQDWDLWLTMLEHGHVGTYIPEVLFTIVSTRGTMSRWVPAFVHRLPWRTESVRTYDAAADIVRRKHRNSQPMP